jgi:hypothetical protein
MTPSACCEVGSPGNFCGDAENPRDAGKTTDECNGTIAETIPVASFCDEEIAVGLRHG